MDPSWRRKGAQIATKTGFEINMKSGNENAQDFAEIVRKWCPNGSRMASKCGGTRAPQDSKNGLGRPRAPRDPLGTDRPPPGLTLEGKSMNNTTKSNQKSGKKLRRC